MTEQIELSSEKYTLRNAYQWLAMITMIMDHIGYLYEIPALRYFGRLGMPLYALLFVMTIRSGHINLKRLLFIALASQFPCMYIFDGEVLKLLLQIPVSEWTFLDIQNFQLNIIFGFAIFAWTVEGINKRRVLQIVAGILMMFLPMSYGWYLYATLFIFWGLRNKILQVAAFTTATGVYTLGYWGLTGMGFALPNWMLIWLPNIHWRQMLASIVPMIGGIKAVRPNKYLYRYFYPGHLFILAIMKYYQLWMPDWYYWY